MTVGRKQNLKQPVLGCKHLYQLLDESTVLTCQKCKGQLTIGDFNFATELVHAMQRSNRTTHLRRPIDGWELRRRKSLQAIWEQ